MTSSTGLPGRTVGDPLVGRLLDGRYQITERLARGGMATVYRGIDTRLTRTVAVKVMHVGLGDDLEFARKFDREARAAARLSHPNVVSVFDQGADLVDGHVSRPYIVMEHVEGQTLRDVINARAPLDPVEALDLMDAVVAALAAAHDAGLVHRDVKPENVLIGGRGRVKVADFGLAKAISSQTQTATQGLLIGTVSYLPPELVVSGHADARSDVYSAGVVLFELLTGHKPHTGDTPIQVAYAHVHADVPAPSGYVTAREVPAYLDALVARATARDPDRRPHDGRVLLAQLRRVRSALVDGVRDDPELTQDLSPVAAAAREDEGDPWARTELVGDRADFEATQQVPSGPVPPAPRPAPSVAAPRESAEAAYPTSLVRPVRSAPPDQARPAPPRAAQAPPPVVPVRDPRRRGASAVQAERVAVHRERARRRRRRGLLVVLLVLLLTVVAALGGWYLTEGRFTSTPALVTLSRAEAGQVAERADLSVGFTEGYSETVPAGQVVETDPGPGTKVRKGGRISAVVSRGPERFPMPGVVGLTSAAASAALQEAHLKVGTVKQGWSDTVAPGVVLSAAQRTGTGLRSGTAVGLVVSKGPKPVRVTDWTGKDADAAVAALRKTGLQVTVAEDHSDDVAAGRVLAQDPATGSLAKGATVTVTRSLGPVLVTVPNVRAMGVRAAEAAMKEAGFKTRVKAAAVNYIGVGFVVSTDPGAASEAPKGSTITLFVV